MIEINESGHDYRIGRMDAFKQLHVSRRLAPIIPTLLPVLLQVAKNEGLSVNDIANSAKILQPFADAMAGMSDADAEYVMTACLAVVQRHSANAWAPVWSERAKSCMFDDIDLGVMMKLTLEVVKDSLGPFIRGLLTSLNEESPESQPAAG
jgi:hypothetical protein